MIYYIRNDIDDLLGFKYNDNIYYYIKNIQDDIIGIVDSNNNIIANYKYDSWGNIISITDNNGNDISNNLNHIANINPFRYRSYYYDTETNLYYLNRRYYNPTWGRFINVDRILSSNGNMLSYNLYIYAGNNFTNNNDIDGMKSSKVLNNIIKKAINITKKAINKVVSIIKSATSSKKITNKSSHKNLPNYSKELNRILKKNAKQAVKDTALMGFSGQLTYFYDNVKAYAKWDYKIENNWNRDINLPYLGNDGQFIYNGKITTSEEFGNLHYGYVGSAMGFSPEILYIGGGYAAKGGFSIEVFFDKYHGDGKKDHNSIKRGIDMYMEE